MRSSRGDREKGRYSIMSNSGSVVCSDFRATIPPSSSTGWEWPTAWEWISLTAIPLGTNENVTVTIDSVSSDEAGNRQINFTVINNTANRTQVFLTLTQPDFSVD